MDSVALNIQDDVEGGQQWLLMYKLIFIIPLILVFAINMVSPSLTITLSLSPVSLPPPSPFYLSLSLSLSHEGVPVDDLPPHSTYHNYAYEQENQQTNDSVLELGTENDSVLVLRTE